MAFNLFDFNAEIEAAYMKAMDPETGEIIDENALAYLDELTEGRDEKIANIGRWIKNLEAEASALKEQKSIFDARMKSTNRKIENLKKYLSAALDGQKWDNDPDKAFKISWRMSKDVVTVDSLESVPEEYFKTPHTESNLNKTAIKEAILNGAVIEGIHLQDNNNIQIK